MAIHFTTSKAQPLLASFDSRISQTQSQGKITTWEKTADGYYTHKAHEWARKAWLRPKVETNRLTFNIIRPQNQKVSPLVYAYYHGHLIETFLNHFDGDFNNAIASALAEAGDDVG